MLQVEQSEEIQRNGEEIEKISQKQENENIPEPLEQEPENHSSEKKSLHERQLNNEDEQKLEDQDQDDQNDVNQNSQRINPDEEELVEDFEKEINDDCEQEDELEQVNDGIEDVPIVENIKEQNDSPVKEIVVENKQVEIVEKKQQIQIKNEDRAKEEVMPQDQTIEASSLEPKYKEHEIKEFNEEQKNQEPSESENKEKNNDDQKQANQEWLKFSKEVFELQNKIRKEPRSFVKYLQTVMKRFVGNKLYLKDLPQTQNEKATKGKTSDDKQKQSVVEEPIQNQFSLTKEGQKAYQDAIKFLENQKPLGPLKWQNELAQAAQDHVNDCASKGLTSNKGSDGSLPNDRINKYGQIDQSWAESCVYNQLNPKEVLANLIVCDGLPQRGYRQAIFNEEFKFCGIFAGDHSTHVNMIQVLYVNKLLKKGEMPTINIINGSGTGTDVVKNLQKLGISSAKESLKVKTEPASSSSIAAAKDRPLTVQAGKKRPPASAIPQIPAKNNPEDQSALKPPSSARQIQKPKLIPSAKSSSALKIAPQTMKQSVSTKIPPLGARKTSAPKIGKPVIPNQKAALQEEQKKQSSNAQKTLKKVSTSANKSKDEKQETAKKAEDPQIDQDKQQTQKLSKTSKSIPGNSSQAQLKANKNLINQSVQLKESAEPKKQVKNLDSSLKAPQNQNSIIKSVSKPELKTKTILNKEQPQKPLKQQESTKLNQKLENEIKKNLRPESGIKIPAKKNSIALPTKIDIKPEQKNQSIIGTQNAQKLIPQQKVPLNKTKSSAALVQEEKKEQKIIAPKNGQIIQKKENQKPEVQDKKEESQEEAIATQKKSLEQTMTTKFDQKIEDQNPGDGVVEKIEF